MSWQAIASSAVGTSHFDSGICQDANAYEVVEAGEIIIGAVSDGMGSAKYSQIGSDAAVQVAITELKRIEWQLQPMHEYVIHEIFYDLVKTITNELNSLSQAHNCYIQDLACTLIVFVASPHWFNAMQIGDGLLVGRSTNGEYELLIAPDKGEYINETSAVTDVKGPQDLNILVRHTSFEFICAATDGIENICLQKNQRWKPFRNFFETLENHLNSTEEHEYKQHELSNLLNSERINKATDDDKTLLLCTYETDRTDFYLESANQAHQSRGHSSKNSGTENRRNVSLPPLSNSVLSQLTLSASQSEDFSTVVAEAPHLGKDISTPAHIDRPFARKMAQVISPAKSDSLLSGSFESIREGIVTEMMLIDDFGKSLNVDIKRKRHHGLDSLEVLIISEKPLLSKVTITQIIRSNMMMPFDSSLPARIRVFNISLGDGEKIQFIRNVDIIDRQAFMISLACFTGLYCLGLIVFCDLVSNQTTTILLSLIVLYSVIFIPLLLYCFYDQSRDW